jgi:hypothetical protein
MFQKSFIAKLFIIEAVVMIINQRSGNGQAARDKFGQSQGGF